MLLLNAVVCGVEICACAGFVYIPPMLLKAGYSEEEMNFILATGSILLDFTSQVCLTPSKVPTIQSAQESGYESSAARTTGTDTQTRTSKIGLECSGVGMTSFCFAMAGLVLVQNVVFVTLMAMLTGFAYATLTTIPFMLVTEYHTDKKVACGKEYK
nr:hypothetical protein BaRGS_006350 [Batillaria attramentaria]